MGDLRGSKPGEHRGGRAKGTANRATALLRDLYDSWANDHEKTKKLFDSLFRLATIEGDDKETGRPLASASAAIGLLRLRFGEAKQETGTGDVVPVVIIGAEVMSPEAWRAVERQRRESVSQPPN